jgi:hypothetical protein
VSSVFLGGDRDRLGREDPVAGNEAPKDPPRTAGTPERSSPPDRPPEPSDRSEASQDRATPAADATPAEPVAQRDEAEERIKELLAGYQRTLDVAEGLPAIVWVRWGDKGLGRYLKVPYLRWFLRYFLTFHISKSLGALDRRLRAIAALADDPDANRADREAVKLYLESLPQPPYSRLVFAVVIAALLVALPLRSFGNVLDVLPLVGAMMRFDVNYVARAFAGSELDNMVRATIVLLLALSVVASLLNSPFVLKRLLFNLHPPTRERIASTAARDHAFSVEGLYALEERVFGEVGQRRPKEGRWDLLFLAFVLVLLLLLSASLGVLALFGAMAWDLTVEVDLGAPTETHVYLPEVHWIFYALPAIVLFVAFVVLLKRLIVAWRGRNRPAGSALRPTLVSSAAIEPKDWRRWGDNGRKH